MKYARLAPLLLLPLLLNGCSTSPRGVRIDATPAELALPPDLTRPINRGFLKLPSELQPPAEQQRQLLPPLPQVALMSRDGQQWLEFERSRESLWPLIQQFWSQAGVELQFNDPTIGVLETVWFHGGEERFTEPTRDKIRLRVLRDSDSDRLQLYLSHYGVRQVEQQWQFRPRDRDLEQELLQRLAQGIAQQIERKNAQQQRAESYRLTAQELQIDEPFAAIWRKSGIALDQLALLISDRNRDRGIYYLKLSNRNFTRSSGFRLIPPDEQSDSPDLTAELKLEEQGGGTRLTVQGLEGWQQEQLLQALRQQFIL